MESKFSKSYFFTALFFALLFFWLSLFGVIDVTRAWTNPSGNPPVGTGSGLLGGSGTAGKISKFTSTNNLGDSVISEDVNGNIGIGNGVPSAKLDVSGSATISGNVGVGTTAPGAKLESYNGSGDNILKLSRGATTSTIFRIGTDSGFVIQNQATDALSIKNGNVGIGTASPVDKLDVQGDINAAGTLWTNGLAVNTGANNPAASIGVNTRVAIVEGGTGRALEIYGGSPQRIYMQLDSGDAGGFPNTGALRLLGTTISSPVINLATSGNGGSWQIGNTVDPVSSLGRLGFFNTAASYYGEKFSILQNGNVGIGTTNPGAKLDVAGGIKSTMWKISNPINNVSGPLTVSGSFTSGGGTLVLFVSGSGYRTACGLGGVNMVISLSSIIYFSSVAMKLYFCPVNTHASLVSHPIIVSGVPAGNPSISLTSWNSGSSDVNDFFNVTVLELPF